MIGLQFSALTMMSIVLLSGCITYNEPRGDWAYPVDLRLNVGALNGAVIAVRCGAGELGEDSWRESILEGCKQTVLAVRSLGAIVVADEALIPVNVTERQQSSVTTSQQGTEQNSTDSGYADIKTTKLVPEMSVLYVDRGIKKERCWRSFPLFLLTTTLWPCIVDKTVFVELRFYDRRDVLIDTRRLDMDMTTVIGIPSGALALARLANLRNYKARRAAISDNLFQYIQNAVHAQHMKTHIAAGSGRQ